MDKDCEIEFNGNLYVLNQCSGEGHENEDFFDWCDRSKVGEFTRYYDRTVFHTESGFVAAYSYNLSIYWDIKKCANQNDVQIITKCILNMKTRRFCPKCGRPVLKSQIKGYAFQCFCCDEDFYRFEVLKKKNMEEVRFIRKQTVLHERQQDYVLHSVKKPYPRYKL